MRSVCADYRSIGMMQRYCCDHEQLLEHEDYIADKEHERYIDVDTMLDCIRLPPENENHLKIPTSASRMKFILNFNQDIAIV